MAIQQEKQLEVCQTCGAFLIVGDAQQRIDDHLAGKQHGGYARIKETLKEEEVCGSISVRECNLMISSYNIKPVVHITFIGKTGKRTGRAP